MADPIVGIGWAVAPIIAFTVNKTLEYLGELSNRPFGMMADLTKLESKIPEILTVLSIADNLKVININQAKLLRQMKDAVYDAEDIIDKFNYRILAKAKVEEADKKSVTKHLTAIVQKARKQCKHMVGAVQLRNSLSKAIKGLENVDTAANAFIRSIDPNNPAHQGDSFGPAPGRETSRTLFENIIVGRDSDCKKILAKIKEQADSDSSTPLVICIVGEGGIGKTTLAQMVCNHHDTAVPNVFEKRIWVCVANTFDGVRVTKKVLEEVKPQNFEHASWDKVINELQESLRTEKSLIVLDDVWVEGDRDTVLNREEWKKFFATFKQCKGGSSIMVTTRLESVVKMIENCTRVDLKGLSIKESNSLFMKHAFSCGVDGDTHNKELEVIGEAIVKKLDGLPLALKFVGMHLNLTKNRSVEHWKKVLENIVFAAGNVLSVLKLSYDHLPPYLKLCFGYCSLFPKGYYFTEEKVEQLVHMWIAQGFINDDQGGDCLEVLGRQTFDDLCSNSFFEQKPGWKGVYYVMHDLIHDLAKSVSEEECYQIQNDGTSIPSTVLRHVSVPSIHLSILSKIPRLDKLRTLLVLNPSEEHVCIPLDDEVLASLTGARVLNLSGCCIELLPKTIEKMIHLRYLAFHRFSTLLPKTCSRLFYLQVLCMTSYRSNKYWDGDECTKNLESCAVENISSLSNLRHIYVQNGDPIEITGHCKVPQFHGDAVFTVNHGNKLEYTQDIGFRGKLVIRDLDKVSSKEDALQAQISQHEHISELKLEWSSFVGASRNNDTDVLEVLKPPSNLSSLTVSGYDGLKSPSWLLNDYLTNLGSLCLSHCRALRELPPLGQLPKLEKLTVDGLNAIKEIPEGFYGSNEVMGFPFLKELTVKNMQNLVEWKIPDYSPMFPLIENVYIDQCDKLSTIPYLLPVTRINYSQQFMLFFVSGESKSYFESLYIHRGRSRKFGYHNYDLNVICWKEENIAGFKYGCCASNNEFYYRDSFFSDIRCHPKAIKDLYLRNYHDLRSEYGFTKFSSLERLTIEDSLWISEGKEKDCKVVRTGGRDGENMDVLPPSLKYLAIIHSPASFLSSIVCRCLRPLSSLQLLVIEDLSELPNKEEEQTIDLQWLTSLTKLQIKNCNELKVINGFEALTCLTTLEMLHCTKLKVLNGFEAHTCLATVEISECPELCLTILTGDSGSLVNSPHANLLFPSLKHLKWDLCQDLKYTNPEGEIDARDIRITSVETVEIISSSYRQITVSISGFLQPFSSLSILKLSSLHLSCASEILNLEHFRELKVLQISHCIGLPQLEILQTSHWIEGLTYHTTMEISECPELSLTILTRDSGSQVNSPHANLFFPYLKHLNWGLRRDYGYTNPAGANEERDIWHNSMDTVEIIGSSNEQITGSFSGFLQYFSYLSILKISSLKMTCSSEILNLEHFSGLKVLHISNCIGLPKIENWHAVTLLEDLDISDCPGLLIHPVDYYNIGFLKLKRCRIPKAYLPMVQSEIDAKDGNNGNELANFPTNRPHLSREDENEVQGTECEDEAKSTNGGPQDAIQRREFDEREAVQNVEFNRQLEQAICNSLKNHNIGSNGGESSSGCNYQYSSSDYDEDDSNIQTDDEE